MHIALFLHSLSLGGAQLRTVMLANGLARRGHRIDLIRVAADAPLDGRADPAVQLWNLSRRPGREVATGFVRSLELALSIAGLARYLRSQKPDVFVGMANHAMLPSVLAHRMSGRTPPKFVLRASNHTVHGRATILKAIGRAILLRFWRQADLILAVSQDVAKDLRPALGGRADRLVVVPSPILPDDQLERIAAPAPAARNGNGPKVMAMGRFVRQKGFDVLLRAFARLTQRVPAELTLVGDGPERASLTALAAELGIGTSVRFTGMVEDPLPLLSAADLFVLSSRWEGMPAVLVEAMACGCPVVSTDCPGGARELLRDGALGPLVPVEDEEALALAMEQALQQAPDREALRAAARAYGTRIAVRSYEKVFLKLLAP